MHIMNASLWGVGMDWREEYKRKLTTAEDAMKAAVRKDDLVMLPIAGPRVLPRALFQRAKELGHDRPAAGGAADGPRVADGLAGALRHRIRDCSSATSGARRRIPGHATYLPNLFSLAFKEQDQRPDEAHPRRRVPDGA